jgi:HEAT repeat protein
MQSELDDIRSLLEQLAEKKEAIPFSELYALSDLTGEELLVFQRTWVSLPMEERRRLTHALVELAEASFQVNFDAIFRYCLQDPDEQVRATAIDGLWENEQVTLVGPLLTMLRTDPSSTVRAAAAMGLGRFVLAGELEKIATPVQTRIMTELLTTIHLAGESIEVRRRALESAAYANTAEVNAALEMAYYEDDEGLRQSALAGMGRTCNMRWAEIVLSELESPVAATRYEAILACGGLQLRAAVALLAPLTKDPDSQIRLATIWALGQIGGSEARRALLEASDDADEGTLAAIEEALAEQALLEDDVDFVLYDLEEDLDDLIEGPLLTVWSADHNDDDEPPASDF